MPAVEVSGLSKRFNQQQGWVLEQLDMTVQKGEFVCLLGASGCGKSTLLNILAGLEQPTTGELAVAHKPSLVFQEPALMPWLTAEKNIELALELNGVQRPLRKEKVSELLELVRLEAAGKKRPHELSGGMKQRVTIARALAQESGILLMDEPFAALDAITRDFLHEELHRIWRQTGITVVFVTHNVREAVRLGQRVLLMSSRPGRILNEWKIDLSEPRSIDSSEVAEQAREITGHLRNEIRRHAVA